MPCIVITCYQRKKNNLLGSILASASSWPPLTDSPAQLHASEAHSSITLGLELTQNRGGMEPGCPLSVVSGVGEVGTELGIAFLLD